MLSWFEIENFRSFEGRARLEMRASRERQHRDRIIPDGSRGYLLPVAAVFGANGSGKSNLYRALRFVQRLVLRPATSPDLPLACDPFRLGEDENAPVRFRLELVPGDTAYWLSLAIDRTGVVEESLEISRGSRNTVVYRRCREPNSGKYAWDIGASLKGNAGDRDFVAFKIRDVSSNQLLLGLLAGKGLSPIDEVTGWFASQLGFMVPGSTLKLLEYSIPTADGLLDFCNRMLRVVDTAIHEIEPEVVDWNEITLAQDLKDEVQHNLKEGQSAFVRATDGKRYTAFRREGRITAARLRTVHRTQSGRRVPFDLSQESEGDQRLLDLLPAFFELVALPHPKVFVVDELDRSLHPLLARQIIASYLMSVRGGHRKQLIFTTHDANLLDQELLRRDEIWLMQRDPRGVSHLLPLAGIAGLRYDRDIRKAYLAGEFGGVPRFPGPLFTDSI